MSRIFNVFRGWYAISSALECHIIISVLNFTTITLAHWPPFVRAAIEYIHKEYPEPWADRQEEATVIILTFIQYEYLHIIFFRIFTGYS
jgi:hypothetical protein